MNDVFIMVICIVALSMGAGMYRDHQKTKRLVGRNQDNDDDLQRELEALKKRVIVLEEIVTDGKYELRRELDQL